MQAQDSAVPSSVNAKKLQKENTLLRQTIQKLNEENVQLKSRAIFAEEQARQIEEKTKVLLNQKQKQMNDMKKHN